MQITGPEHSIPQDSAVGKNSMNNADQPSVDPPSNQIKKSLSSSQALSKLKKKLNRQGLKQQ